MTVFLMLGSLFSVVYMGGTRWYFPGASEGIAWYFGYIVCYALAAMIGFKTPVNSASEVLIIALKALLPVSGLLLFVYGLFLQFMTSTAPLGNGDVLDTTTSMLGTLCIVTGIVMVIISLWAIRKN
ncbi:hypothetical protein [Erwinia tasmaniensis]|uniref:Uncharacterized protein n=1 Tax=Erwinia tasmaniensis (strain DSM 17950 / CFBP 7177 / CIP 109463 / NCPPB 4357 / Et1/99) TaxID=465817 RepID=B2VB34_ERWT9|nr:hypothetical protein [Erwinia tasmaniensis]CAO94990.1 hypothetical protein ETA_pET450460 [Erwinia tasmaniensis Et1/99]